MRLGHLNLTVSDLTRAADFYGRWFGFDRVLADYPDGTRFLTGGDGFELALHEGGPASASESWHFGFVMPDARSVKVLHSAIDAAGVPVAEAVDSDGYVGFKCKDPDGHQIEVYFEPRNVERSGRLVIPPSGTSIDDSDVQALRDVDHR